MNIKLKLAATLALMSALLIGCSSSSSSSSSDVTLSGVVSTTTGTTTAAAAGGINKTVGGVAAQALTGYTLYCVTFTSTTHSGTGALTLDSATGNYTYSVTLTNAAGLPIGCFINDSTNTPVSTVTFNISGSTGSISSSTSGTALTSGSHTVNIVFNPTTGASTATVASTSVDTSASTSGGTATSMLTAMAGGWNMSCPGSIPADISPLASGTTLTATQVAELSKCQLFLYADNPNTGVYTWRGTANGFPIYLNFVSGTMGGQTVHAMGVWNGNVGNNPLPLTAAQYAQAYTACGSTEGMDSAALTTLGVTGLSQTNSSTVSPDAPFDDTTSTYQGADHLGLVNGSAYTTATVANANGGYDTSASTSLAQLIAVLPPAGSATTPAYDGSWNNQWLGGGTDWCPDNSVVSPPFTVDNNTLLNDTSSTGAQARSCYVGWVESLAETQGPGSAPAQACMPRIDGNGAQNAIWGTTGSAPFPVATAITVKYRTSLAGSPQIGNRYALMGLNLVSNTGIANDHEEQQWSYWDQSLNSGAGGNVTCNYAQDMTITMIPDMSASPATTAAGHFDIKDYQNCVDSSNNTVSVPGNGDTYATFDVNFTR